MHKKIAIALVLLLGIVLGNSAIAGQVTLKWDANTEPDLAGYKLYYGLASGTYGTPIDVGNVTTYALTGLANGQTYYIAATAYDTVGNKSGYSHEITCTPDTTEVYQNNFESSVADWNNGALGFGGGAKVELVTGTYFTGTHSMKVSGGTTVQSVRKTLINVPEGDLEVIHGAAYVPGAATNIYIGKNSVGTYNHEYTVFPSNGGWQLFAFPVVTNQQDAALGMDVFGAIQVGQRTMYLDDFIKDNVIYSNDFSANIVGWNNGAGGGATLTRTSTDVFLGNGALKISGGTKQCARVTIYGIPKGITVRVNSWGKVNGIAPGPFTIRTSRNGGTNYNYSDPIPGGDWRYFSFKHEVGKTDSLETTNGVNFDFCANGSTEELILDEFSIKLEGKIYQSSFGNTVKDWNNGVYMIGGGANLARSDIYQDSGASLSISGGNLQAGKTTIFGLAAGENMVSSYLARADGNGPIYSTLEGLFQPDWTEEWINRLPDEWQRFSVVKPLSSLDISGLDMNVVGWYPDGTLYVEEAKLQALLYYNDFSESITDWNSNVPYIGTGSTLSQSMEESYTGTYSLKVTGGSVYPAARTVISGLTPGAIITAEVPVKSKGTGLVHIWLREIGTDLKQSKVAPNGTWQPLAVSKKAIGTSMELAIFTEDPPSSAFYVGEVRISK